MFDNRKMGKIIPIKLDDEEGDEDLYLLTFRMARALLNTIEYMRWQSRHLTIPSDLNTQDKLNEWVDNLTLRLMKEINPLEGVCAAIINCFETDEDVKESLYNTLVNYPAFQQFMKDFGGVSSPISIGDKTGISITGSCDEDILFGQIREVVNQQHTANLDLLERVEAGTNTAEKAALLFAGIPILETLPFDEMGEYADMVLEDFLENYTSQWSTELYDTICCDLFCLAINNPDCALSMADLLSYYSATLGEEISPSVLFRTGIAYIASGTWFGDQIVYAMMVAQMMCWGYTGQFFGVHLYSLKKLADIASPDETWDGLCDDCIPVIELCEDAGLELDFTESTQDFVGLFSGGYGEWHPGEGWGIGSFAFSITVERESNLPITKVRAYWAVEESSSYYIRQYSGGGLGAVIDTGYTSGVDGNGFWTEWDLPTTEDGLCIQSLTSNSAQRLFHTCIWYEE